MSTFEKVRDIINIVVAIILGVSSIAVAIFANGIASSANKAAELQALIAKNAEAPTIELFHSVGGTQNEASIRISILDGKYSNFDSSTVSFLSFTFSGPDENGDWGVSSRIDIPIDYYTSGGGPQTMCGNI